MKLSRVQASPQRANYAGRKKNVVDSDEEDDVNLIAFETLSGYASEIDEFYSTVSTETDTNTDSNWKSTIDTDSNTVLVDEAETAGLEILDSDDLLNMFENEHYTNEDNEYNECCHAYKRHREQIMSLSTQVDLIQKELKRLRADYTSPSTDIDL